MNTQPEVDNSLQELYGVTSVWVTMADIENHGIELAAHRTEAAGAASLCLGYLLDSARNVLQYEAQDFPEDADVARRFIELVEAKRYVEAYELYREENTGATEVFPDTRNHYRLEECELP